MNKKPNTKVIEVKMSTLSDEETLKLIDEIGEENRHLLDELKSPFPQPHEKKENKWYNNIRMC